MPVSRRQCSRAQASKGAGVAGEQEKHGEGEPGDQRDGDGGHILGSGAGTMRYARGMEDMSCPMICRTVSVFALASTECCCSMMTFCLEFSPTCL